MREKFLDYFKCIKCKDGNSRIINISKGVRSGDVIDGECRCDVCGSSFFIRNGIARFVSGDNYGDSFGLQWNSHRKTQIDSYSGLPISRNRLYDVTGWTKDLHGLKILEVGSGAGRFTEILLETGAMIFSFDFSSAVDANYANNGSCLNLCLFQGDISNIPLHKGLFDKVICIGVIQHTPEPASSFKSLAECVRPGGELVIDVYAKKITSVLSWKYLLRPLTKRVDKKFLYRVISTIVPYGLPLAIILHKLAGKFGSKLVPIVEYSSLVLSYEMNTQWAILDTFDMYSPEYDYPQTLRTVTGWFKEAGFVNIIVKYGLNGIVGKGFRPA